MKRTLGPAFSSVPTFRSVSLDENLFDLTKLWDGGDT